MPLHTDPMEVPSRRYLRIHLFLFNKHQDKEYLASHGITKAVIRVLPPYCELTPYTRKKDYELTLVHMAKINDFKIILTASATSHPSRLSSAHLQRNTATRTSTCGARYISMSNFRSTMTPTVTRRSSSSD